MLVSDSDGCAACRVSKTAVGHAEAAADGIGHDLSVSLVSADMDILSSEAKDVLDEKTQTPNRNVSSNNRAVPMFCLRIIL